MELKKAATIEEAYQVFETNVPLNREQNREFYVDIYHKDLLNLRKELKLNQIPDKSFFVTGQSGNGKSTALNFLPDESINTDYDVKYLNGRDVFKLDDIDIILMIDYTIVKGNKPLEKNIWQSWSPLKKRNLENWRNRMTKPA